MKPHEAEMLWLLSGYWFSQTLYAAAELRIADRLAGGPKTADGLADEAAVDPEALYRLLRALSSAGIFAEVGPRTFALTPLSETLREDREGSLRPVALLGGHPLHWQAWGGLLQAVKNGESAFEAAHGHGLFDALRANDELRATFHQVLSRASDLEQSVADLVAPRGFRRIIDLGGGTGGLAARLAGACGGAEVWLFDREEVLNAAPARAGVKLEPGDFLAGVPAGGDAYVLKFTLHDWPDREAIRILSSCRNAMLPEGRVFVIEVIVPEGPVASIAKTHDVNMLVLTGGRERTLAEYERLFAAAGLSLLRAIATPSGASVLETASVSAAS
jgi:hypothetical protein